MVVVPGRMVVVVVVPGRMVLVPGRMVVVLGRAAVADDSWRFCLKVCVGCIKSKQRNDPKYYESSE
jgi:hypothetical protein